MMLLTIKAHAIAALASGTLMLWWAGVVITTWRERALVQPELVHILECSKLPPVSLERNPSRYWPWCMAMAGALLLLAVFCGYNCWALYKLR